MLDDLAQKTASDWLSSNDQAFVHFEYCKRQLKKLILLIVIDRPSKLAGIEIQMANIEILFFDVLGTVVDWRGSIAAEVTSFLERHDAAHIDAGALADAWVGRYDSSVEAIRCGQRPFVTLDVLNLENLEASLTSFGLTTATLPRTELENLNLAWHRLKPWPDSVEGIFRLKEHFVVAPLSDGNTRLLVDMARNARLSWDTIFGADVSRAYKPMPQVYLRACELLDVTPDRAMLIAAHDYDLEAARGCGLKTAYVARQNAHDPSQADRATQIADWDYSASSLLELAEVLR